MDATDQIRGPRHAKIAGTLLVRLPCKVGIPPCRASSSSYDAPQGHVLAVMESAYLAQAVLPAPGGCARAGGSCSSCTMSTRDMWPCHGRRSPCCASYILQTERL